MRNNETGEFELVVGNRQLLSGFFIVVLLFAVAFAMGYVVGENSHSAKPAEAATNTAVPPATQADARPQPASAAPTPTPTQAAETAPETPASEPAQPSTQPARQEQAPSETRPAPRPVESSPVPPAAVPKADPPPGSYWQVIATANPDSAQTLLQTLKDKGFPASLSPGPNNLTRVLVGPYTDTTSMGRAKTELENAGFVHLVRK